MRLLTRIIHRTDRYVWTWPARDLQRFQKSNDYDYKLRIADKYYAAKDYNHAQQLFEELFRVFKGSEHFEDIYYKFAYCAYYLKDYANAENLFQGVSWRCSRTATRPKRWIICGPIRFINSRRRCSWIRPIRPRRSGSCSSSSTTIPARRGSRRRGISSINAGRKLELKEFESRRTIFNLGASS